MGCCHADLLGRIVAGDKDLPGCGRRLPPGRGETVRARRPTAPGLPAAACGPPFRAELDRRPTATRPSALTREQWLLAAAPRARLRPGPDRARRRARRRRTGRSRSATAGSTCRSTCSAGASTSTDAPRASPAPPSAPRRRWCRSCSTAPTTTCGRCVSNGRAAAAAARLHARSSGRPTSSSTWRRSSTASCSPTSSLLFLLCHESRFEVPEGDAGRRLLAGALAHDRHRVRHPRARPAARRRAGRIERPRHRVPAAPGERRAARPARRRRPGAATTTTARCCGWSTGCCSCSSPRTATPCSTRTRPRRAASRYADYFSTAPAARAGPRRRGTAHGDLWEALSHRARRASVDEGGRAELGLPGLGGLFDHGPADVVSRTASWPTRPARPPSAPVGRADPRASRRRAVDYRNLGAEELGSIYESLLELVPRYDPARPAPSRSRPLAGNERKTTGSYYTPTSLIECLLDSALDPVLDDARAERRPRRRRPPARRSPSATRPAAPGTSSSPPPAGSPTGSPIVRTGDAEPTPDDRPGTRMHDVVGRCIYGVDLNPMAAELAKVSLWLEALEPGKPLSFLDAHIKVGNGLLGATPALLADGIPDAAVQADRGRRPEVRRRLAQAQQGTSATGRAGSVRRDRSCRTSTTGTARNDVRKVAIGASLSLADVARCAAPATPHTSPRRSSTSARAARRRLVCRLRLQLKQRGAAVDHRPDVVTDARHPTQPVTRGALATRSSRLAAELPVLPLAPGVPGALRRARGWRANEDRLAGGFSAVLGNPPWERVKLQEQEFFAARDPTIAAAPNAAARKRLIADLRDVDIPLHAEFVAAKRRGRGREPLLRELAAATRSPGAATSTPTRSSPRPTAT